MLLGILSDAHGNVAGLDRCLRVLKKLGVDKILFLGDALGYFPHNRAVCTMLMRFDALCLMGNHEACFLGYLPITVEQEAIIRYDWCKNIPSKWLHKIETMGPSYTFSAGNKQILCVHATPQDPLSGRHSTFSRTIEDVDFVFAGHSHRSSIFQSEKEVDINPTCYVNVGSCGYPRDHGTLLSVAVFDTVNHTTRLWRIPFSFSTSILQRVHVRVAATTQTSTQNFVGTLWTHHE